MSTVTVDAKRRIPLPRAQPGERFDVKIEENGRYILHRLIPEPASPHRMGKVMRKGKVKVYDGPVPEVDIVEAINAVRRQK